MRGPRAILSLFGPEIGIALVATAILVSQLAGLVEWSELGNRLRWLPYAAPFAIGYAAFSAGRRARNLRRGRDPDGALPAAGKPAEPAGADPIEHDRFVIAQRFAMMINRYDVFTLHEDGRSAGRRVAFVEQKRLALKEDLRAFTHEGKLDELFRIKARQVFDPRARYDVTDPDGRRIGQLGKVFGRSLFRSTWELFDARGERVAQAQERSVPVAIWRRFVDFIPLVGELLSWIPVRYHFDFEAGGRRIATFDRRVGLRDRYVLDLSADAEHVLDRRLALALAIGLDALQAR